MDLPPAAPTPPASGSAALGSERTANLLNLLKFSGGGSSSGAQQSLSQSLSQSQQSPTQHQHQQQQGQSPTEQLSQFHQHQQQQPQPQQQSYPPQPILRQQQLGLPQSQYPTRIHQPAPTSADPSGLLAALMRGAQESEEPKVAPAPPPPAQSQQQPQLFGNGEPSADTTSYLLNLLNRPKPSQSEQQPMLNERARSDNRSSQSPDLPGTAVGGEAPRHLSQYQQPSESYSSAPQYRSSGSYVDVQNLSPSAERPQHPPSYDAAADLALYQQVMGSLVPAAPPIHHVHGKPDQGSPAGSQHLEPPRSGSGQSPITSPSDRARHRPARTSSKQTPPGSDFASHHSPGIPRETVSEALGDVAHQADLEARRAVDRAEHERNRAEIVDDLDDMLNARSEREFEDSAQAAAQALQRELDMEDNSGALEDRLPASVAHTVRDIIDDAAAQGVADSWESADQDEIVVIEEKETPPVKVFNFPMKPWISISLQEGGTEPRPEFRDETIMDIARLKKEFDQIDRNLYTASQNYMTYGMSKQGGLRVIRQDDGKDAKVFTDTKDRIFNVAISVTPPDHDGAEREAIIGTGISGTVYWVQIKDGEKDHIEDAHLEQYGFALPPMNTNEGDAPGGALKTRARASTIHPEFFAVGRGKSINLIWPSYIMQNNLFKPGHDRVVDTDKLLKQCSLKINTGKAGKDFTFSQDDTVVASLDKSGRVKFWDVRKLTATKEGSDPRAPMPAQASFEVKEPLMTLASTPEGEKAWPTSVLLLDKQRPYQKRCALRYMIVGMKQNHTIQLWDLALGKPVQEFNLPHSKESDAVCSVMYHPTTGMIVIGHPTRNSVYFAHLSAPKYNLKSVSQAEYIQRLAAQDSSMPQPDSTAVISGVREYSFDNRGDLRSLDILCSPAMVQDTDEPTLFELYAMHSKGVACLLVKQPELGWSKDNKVLDPVDAVLDGVVTVSKLKPLQPAESGSSSDIPQGRNANRGLSKEPSLLATPAQTETSQRGLEAVTPVKAKNEAKEVETPQQAPKEGQSEKSERKSRKKKAAAANASESATNGTMNNPLFTPTGKAEASKAPVISGFSSETLDAAVTAMEARLTASLSDSLKSSLKSMSNKIDDGARARDENFNQHQLKLLDMVSEVLNENTQKVLEALIHQQFTDLVIPAIGDKAGKAVTDLLEHKLQPNVSASVQKEIQSSLPHALNRSLRSGDFVAAISDRVGASVVSSVQQEVLSSITQRLTPAFSHIAKQTAQSVAGEVHQQYREQIEQMNARHGADSRKVDQLLSYVSTLTDMVSTMAASQSSLQAEFLKFKQQPVHELPGVQAAAAGGQGYGSQGYSNNNMMATKPQSHAGSYSHGQPANQGYMGSPQYTRGSQLMSSPHGSTIASEQVGPGNMNALAGAYATGVNKNDTEADLDLAHRIRVVEQAIQEGRLQEAMIQWIQSGRESEIFRRCLSRFPPSKFENLPPLMLLVVIATISKDLKPNPRIKEEIEWVEMAVRAFGDNMPSYDWEQQGTREVMNSTSQTMQMLVNRLKPLIAGIQDGYPTDPFLASLEKGKLEWIVRTSEHILDSFRPPRHYE